MAYASGTWMVWTVDLDNGADADYSSWSALQTAQAGDLTSRGSGYWVNIIASQGNLDPWNNVSRNLFVDGWTCDATHPLVITSPESYRHNGKFDVTKPFFFSGNSAATGTNPFTIQDDNDYVEIFGVQIIGSGSVSSSRGICNIETGGGDMESFKFHHNIVAGIHQTGTNRLFRDVSGDGRVFIWNNQFVSSSTSYVMQFSTGLSGVISNNTMVTQNNLYFALNSDIIFRNNIIQFEDGSTMSGPPNQNESLYNYVGIGGGSSVPTSHALKTLLPSGSNYVGGTMGKGMFVDGSWGEGLDTDESLNYKCDPLNRAPISLEFSYQKASGDNYIAVRPEINDSTDIMFRPRTKFTIGAFEHQETPMSSTREIPVNSLQFADNIQFADVINKLTLQELFELMHVYSIIPRRIVSPEHMPSYLSVWGQLTYVFYNIYNVGTDSAFDFSPREALDELIKRFEFDRYEFLSHIHEQTLFKIMYHKLQPETSSNDPTEDIYCIMWLDPGNISGGNDDFPYLDNQRIFCPGNRLFSEDASSDNRTWYQGPDFINYMKHGLIPGPDGNPSGHQYGPMPEGWKTLRLSNTLRIDPYTKVSGSGIAMKDQTTGTTTMWDYGSVVNGVKTNEYLVSYTKTEGDSPYGSGAQWRMPWGTTHIAYASGECEAFCQELIANNVDLDILIVDLELENEIGSDSVAGLLEVDTTHMQPAYLADYPDTATAIMADDKWPAWAAKYGVDEDISDMATWWRGGSSSIAYPGEKAKKWLRAQYLAYIDTLNDAYAKPVRKHFPNCQMWEFRTRYISHGTHPEGRNTGIFGPYSIGSTFGSTEGGNSNYLDGVGDDAYSYVHEYYEPVELYDVATSGTQFTHKGFWGTFSLNTTNCKSMRDAVVDGFNQYLYVAASGFPHMRNNPGGGDFHRGWNSTPYRTELINHGLLCGARLSIWSTHFSGPDDHKALDDAILEFEDVVGNTHPSHRHLHREDWEPKSTKIPLHPVYNQAQGSTSGLPYIATTSDIGGNIWTRVTIRPDLIGVLSPTQSGNYLVLDWTDPEGISTYNSYYVGEIVPRSTTPHLNVMPEPSGYWIKQPKLQGNAQGYLRNQINAEVKTLKGIFTTTTAGRTGSEQKTTYIGGNVGFGDSQEIVYTTNSSVSSSQSTTQAINIDGGQTKAKGGAEGGTTDQNSTIGYVQTRQSLNSDEYTVFNYATGKPVTTSPWTTLPSGQTDTFATDSTNTGRSDRLGIHVIKGGQPGEI